MRTLFEREYGEVEWEKTTFEWHFEYELGRQVRTWKLYLEITERRGEVYNVPTFRSSPFHGSALAPKSRRPPTAMVLELVSQTKLIFISDALSHAMPKLNVNALSTLMLEVILSGKRRT